MAANGEKMYMKAHMVVVFAPMPADRWKSANGVVKRALLFYVTTLSRTQEK